jgi:hypothetical protein
LLTLTTTMAEQAPFFVEFDTLGRGRSIFLFLVADFFSQQIV